MILKTTMRLIIFLFLVSSNFIFGQTIFSTQEGNVQFQSDAPLEIITAKSSQLKGAIDINNRTFAFTVNIKSFNGFNSPLQQEHFNENYLESHLYEEASFTGKIIEKIDLSKHGEYTIRAKGKLNIHGVEQERIIKSKIIINEMQFEIESFFTVYLSEHDILIPKIVSQKIAEEIKVKIECNLIQN